MFVFVIIHLKWINTNINHSHFCDGCNHLEVNPVKLEMIFHYSMYDQLTLTLSL